jgi:hypothetical protein
VPGRSEDAVRKSGNLSISKAAGAKSDGASSKGADLMSAPFDLQI